MKIDTNERIFVHEFSNSNSAKSKEEHILAASALIEWIGTPHLYRKFNIIVLYMGENEIIHKDLGKIIGKPRVDFARYRHP